MSNKPDVQRRADMKWRSVNKSTLSKIRKAYYLRNKERLSEYYKERYLLKKQSSSSI